MPQAKISPHLKSKRKEALLRQGLVAAEAAINHRLIEAQAAHPDLPSSDADVQIVKQTSIDEATKLKDAIESQGADSTEIVKEIDAIRRERLQQQLAAWTNDLELTKDYLEHPEHWAGVDLGGRPLDEDQLKVDIARLETSVKIIDEELSSMDTNRAVRRAESKRK